MPYSQFACPSCGKMREVTGSKYIFVLGSRKRACAACVEVRRKQQKREAENGKNG